MKNVIRCPECGDLYETMSMTVKDQSKCPTCLMKEHEELKEAKEKRQQQFKSV